MKSSKLSIKQIIAIAGMSLLFCVILGANIVGGMLNSLITEFFHGYGIVAEGVEIEKQLEDSAALAEEIASEGIMLLRNENDTLPLKSNEVGNISIFGWGATDGGFVLSGSGSGEADTSTAKTFLGSMRAQGFTPNQLLIDYAEEYKDGREGYSLTGHSHVFFRLYEPTINASRMQTARAHSDIAMIVISRLGGEGKDLPTVQYRANTAGARPTHLTDVTIDPNRTYLEISIEEEALIKGVAAAGFEKVILLVNACNVMQLGFIEDPDFGIDAVLSVGPLGTAGTGAIPKILKGEIAPSGKTVNTWMREFQHDPTFLTSGQNFVTGHDQQTTFARATVAPTGVNPNVSHVVGHLGIGVYRDLQQDPLNSITINPRGVQAGEGGHYVDYQEGIYVGYRYYETAHFESTRHAVTGAPIAAGHADSGFPGFIYQEKVQFPFGYGLSYTNFEWTIEEPSMSTDTLTRDTQFTVKVRVRNTGTVAGKDVVQVYVNPPYYSGEVEKSFVQLVAFGKTGLLAPNAYEDLTLTFDAYDFASFDSYKLSGKTANSPHAALDFDGFILDPGAYVVRVQTDSHTLAPGANAETTFNLAAAIKFDQESTVTVENKDGERGADRTLIAARSLFTGATAEGGTPIDGKVGALSVGFNSGAGINQMTRANFAGTFPDETRVQRSRRRDGVGANRIIGINGSTWGANIPLAQLNENTSIDYLKFPTSPSAQGVSGTLNISERETLDILGKDITDPLWDTLLSQMSIDEMYSLVQRGGYRTVRVESIGKPRCWDFDGPSGLNTNNMSDHDSAPWTAFPVATIIAQTWSAELAYEFGAAVGTEARLTDVAGWYAPGVNLHRSPFAGRNFEYFSEDAHISGIMGAQVTNGALSEGLYAYVKHFVVNETETHRGKLNTWLSEQTLREIYLRPFEITVKQGSANAMMSSFNMLGAMWTGGSRALCTTILREEWGFRGSVVTDFANALSDTHMSAAQGLRAGNDLWLTGLATDGAPGFGNSHLDINSNRTADVNVILLRNASRNILYTFANTYWYSGHGPRAETSVFPMWWIWGMLPLNLVLAGGIATILYLNFFHKKRKPKFAAEGADGTGGDTDVSKFTSSGSVADSVSDVPDAIVAAAQAPPEPTPEPAAETAPEPTPEPAAETAPEPTPEPATEEKPAPKPKTASAAKPKTAASTTAKPKTASAKAATAAKPKTASAAKPKAEKPPEASE